MLTFVKDYKNDNALRQSFDTLAKQTFGISFEAWYQSGCWDDHYMTYSFMDAGKIVANVSANRMTLKMEGTEAPISAIQIGTVMTDPAYRRKGLAYELIQKIFEDFDHETTLYYLAADREAQPLYEKCGFVEVAETFYQTILSTEKSKREPSTEESATLVKMKLTLDAFLKLKRNAKGKGSRFDVIDDAHIAAFYWFHGFNDNLYTLGDNCLVIADISEDSRTMTLYDYYVVDTRYPNTHGIGLASILNAIEQMPERQIEQVDFAFDVTGMALNRTLVSRTEEKSGWMIRALGQQHFPEFFCYPKLAQT